MHILEEENEFNEGGGKVPSFQRNGSMVCLPPLLLIDSFSRKSVSYNKLPQEPLRLTVLKLDGATFEIEVAKNGTIAELKQAVEAAFRHLPNVSWPHVWGHFCLCYDSQKLLSDTDDIGCYGMKDGDQLQFIRHVSINYNTRRKKPERELPDIGEPTISDDCEGEQKNSLEHQCHEEDIEYQKSSDDDDTDDGEEDNSVIMTCEYKLAHLLRGWFSYRKLSNSDLNTEPKSNSSKFSNSFLGSFKNVIRLHTNKYNSSERETWKAK